MTWKISVTVHRSSDFVKDVSAMPANLDGRNPLLGVFLSHSREWTEDVLGIENTGLFANDPAPGKAVAPLVNLCGWQGKPKRPLNSMAR